MSRTITVSDHVYERLEAEARARGMKSIEQLLEQLPQHSQKPLTITPEELQQRQAAVARIDAIYEEMRRKYGTMPDSVDLIREDRER